MHNRLIRLAMSAALAMPLFALPAHSAGDGPPDPVQCPKGKVYDKASKKCVPAQRGATDDDSLYETGKSLAMAGRYDEAIAVLGLASNKKDPRILNYLGYSHRKAGRVIVGLGYYQEALLQDPDYTLVREYLGEAHLQLGDVTAARAQLGEIARRCGTGCDEYVELRKQIADHVKG